MGAMRDPKVEEMTEQSYPRPAPQLLVIVTGPSGAGRSTAINVLEDLGYEAIDNMPLSLVARLVEGPPPDRPIAVGIDIRNRDFSAPDLFDLLDWLAGQRGIEAQMLFLECSEDALVRRYSETRRRHPLASQEAPIEGIRQEIDLLAPVRARAEVLIDTTDLTPHDLKAALTEWFAPEGGVAMGVTVHSFSYKKGVPKGLDMMFDCRFLSNPHWDAALRGKTGLDPAVRAHVAADPLFDDFLDRVSDLLLILLPAFKREGKAHLSVGFGCTGGQHRSVVLTEIVSDRLAEAGWQVSKRHREQDRWARLGAGQGRKP